MPHVIVKLYPGRTEEQKEALTEKITSAVMESFGVDASSVSFAFEETPKEKWPKEVYKPDILGKEQTLYKKPGYSYTESEIE
jgi:4-oxalocrotonate tautomerase